jgi:hypothetical protein
VDNGAYGSADLGEALPIVLAGAGNGAVGATEEGRHACWMDRLSPRIGSIGRDKYWLRSGKSGARKNILGRALNAVFERATKSVKTRKPTCIGNAGRGLRDLLEMLL